MTLAQLEAVVAAQTTWINSVIANSKLPSELVEKSDITDVNEVGILQSGVADSEAVKTGLLRGYRGTWNASTNTPVLVNGTGLDLDTYCVSVAGTQDFGDGDIYFKVNDIARYLNGKWTSAVGGFTVESFTATHNQTSMTVAKNEIADDGLWSVQVGSMLLNSTTGITSFTNGAITINFATGEITFLNPLQGGTQVIIKYN